jgi:hypothetical protein
MLPVDVLGRIFSAILCMAATANVLLIKVSFEKGIFQWAISLSAGFVAFLMADRAFFTRKLRIRHAYAALLSTCMWYANTIEVLTAVEVKFPSRIRLGLMYLTFSTASCILYLVQRVILETRKTGEGNGS